MRTLFDAAIRHVARTHPRFCEACCLRWMRLNREGMVGREADHHACQKVDGMMACLHEGKKTYFDELLDVDIKADIELKRLELKQAMLTSAAVKAYPHDTP